MDTTRAVIVCFAVACAVLTSGSSCPVFGPQNRECRTNLECGPYRECNTRTGQCRCTDNRGCGAGEFCNAVQQCQVVAGCVDNGDCDEQGDNLICNVKTSQCETAELCYDDAHCPLGRFCDAMVGACVEGCRDEGDCPLKAGCIRDPPSAVYGTCRTNACSVSDQCQPGFNCDLLTSQCVQDRRGPFCGPCQSFDPTDPECGDDPANYCLIDTGDPTGRGHYCGVDCFYGQACPSGYSCEDVIIVGLPGTEQCFREECRNGQCTVSQGASCHEQRDCPFGLPGGNCQRAREGICAGTLDQRCRDDGECGGSPGSCHLASCSGGENEAIGFCTCVIDLDCPQDTCRGADLSNPANPVRGRCFLSGHYCYEDEDCSTISCVNGGCLIGRNCAPSGERRCVELGMTP